jgi:hypothetical protein
MAVLCYYRRVLYFNPCVNTPLSQRGTAYVLSRYHYCREKRDEYVEAVTTCFLGMSIYLAPQPRRRRAIRANPRPDCALPHRDNPPALWVSAWGGAGSPRGQKRRGTESAGETPSWGKRTVEIAWRTRFCDPSNAHRVALREEGGSGVT